MRKSHIILCVLTVVALTGCGANQKPQKAEVENKLAAEPKVQMQIPEKQPEPLEGKLIVVDAGHGISQVNRTEAVAPDSNETKSAFVSGTRGANQTEEELNLAIALKLRDALTKKGAVVKMTREDHTTDKSNIDRAVFGNELGADISVKIHADGSNNSSANGISVLVPGNLHITDSKMLQNSRRAGELVLDELISETGAVNRGISVRNDMTGFNWSEIPVILVESGFMTNPAEDALMETDEYRQKIADGIVNGLERYFSD